MATTSLDSVVMKMIFPLKARNYFTHRKYPSTMNPYLQVIRRVELAIIVSMSFCMLRVGDSGETLGKPGDKEMNVMPTELDLLGNTFQRQCTLGLKRPLHHALYKNANLLFTIPSKSSQAVS